PGGLQVHHAVVERLVVALARRGRARGRVRGRRLRRATLALLPPPRLGLPEAVAADGVPVLDHLAGVGVHQVLHLLRGRGAVGHPLRADQVRVAVLAVRALGDHALGARGDVGGLAVRLLRRLHRLVGGEPRLVLAQVRRDGGRPAGDVPHLAVRPEVDDLLLAEHRHAVLGAVHADVRHAQLVALHRPRDEAGARGGDALLLRGDGVAGVLHELLAGGGLQGDGTGPRRVAQVQAGKRNAGAGDGLAQLLARGPPGLAVEGGLRRQRRDLRRRRRGEVRLLDGGLRGEGLGDGLGWGADG